MERRVVITAASAITPIGHAKDELIDSLINGKSGVKKIRKDDLLTDRVESQVFGTVSYPIDFNFKRKYRKTMGPVAFYACQVVKRRLNPPVWNRTSYLRAGLGRLLAPPMAVQRYRDRSMSIFSAARKSGSPPSVQ